VGIEYLPYDDRSPKIKRFVDDFLIEGDWLVHGVLTSTGQHVKISGIIQSTIDTILFKYNLIYLLCQVSKYNLDSFDGCSGGEAA
jgi:hypothetical protein